MAHNKSTLRESAYTNSSGTFVDLKHYTIRIDKEILDDPNIGDRIWTSSMNNGRKSYIHSKIETGATASGKTTIYLHRLILRTPKNKYADHINGDVTDNRFCNLRNATPRQNNQNRGICSRNKTGIIGVKRFVRKSGKVNYRAQISDRRRHNIYKFFDTLEEAKAWRFMMENLLYKEFAPTRRPK
jgi:hypothetical protein